MADFIKLAKFKRENGFCDPDCEFIKAFCGECIVCAEADYISNGGD